MTVFLTLSLFGVFHVNIIQLMTFNEVDTRIY